MPDIITITDDNYRGFIDSADDMPGDHKGLTPRDFATFPVGHYANAGPIDFPLFSDEQIEKEIRNQEENGSSLEHLRMTYDGGKPIDALDQNGQGYCWAYSTTSCVTLARAKQGMPYEPLSGHMIGCIIKNYRNQGGWNAQSMQFAQEHGVASQKFWPAKSMSRSNDTPEMREDARKRRITEWWDLSDDPETVKRQLATLLLLNCPVAVDFNWWLHSVCAIRLMSWRPFKIRILNSWSNSWSKLGMGDLEGGRAIPNGAIAPRVITAKAA